MAAPRPRRSSFTAAALGLLLVGPLAAQHVALLQQPKVPVVKSAADRAPRIVEIFGVAPLASLSPVGVAEPQRLAAVHAWNEARRTPLRDGLVRALPHPATVTLPTSLGQQGVASLAGGLVAPTTFDRLAWGAAVTVQGSYRLRLHFSKVALPAGSRIWVHSGGEEKGPFGLELRDPQGGLWTPSVDGDTVAVDVELPVAGLGPRDHPSFVLDAVAEVLPKDDTTTGPCDTDSSCAPAAQASLIDAAKHAIASIQFIEGDSEFLCSGGLLNDTRNDGTPFFLTANHCISDSSAAASVEAFWDYYTSSCGGAPPDINSVPFSEGAQLLATGDADTQSDYTLLKLNNVPSGRTFLGWNANLNAAPDGAAMFRLSSPGQEPLSFCATQSNLEVPDCGGPRSEFLYSSYVLGGTFGGSSGAPSMLSNGEVVGQLYGGCNDPDDCSPNQYTIDGGFFASFPHLAGFLAPTGGGGVGPCRANATTLCLDGNRFTVTVVWTNQFNGTSGTGRAVHASDSSGFFTFTDPSNYELILKMLNFGDVFKFFYGELTDLQFTITVSDAVTGNTKQYSNTPGDCGAIDESAFPAQVKSMAIGESEIAGTCRPSSTTLCLLNRRLAVTATWQNQFNNTHGVGTPVALSDETGRFSFLDPSDVELVLKALYFGNTIKFFYGALSDFGYVITVTDTTTGAVNTYTNPPGNYCGGIDNSAF